MRTETPMLSITAPQGTDLTKPQHRRFITNLYIGSNSKGESQIQIGNSIVPMESVGDVMLSLRNRLNDADAENFIVNIRADKSTPMGIITDVKQQLRRAGALKIRYSATEEGRAPSKASK